MHNDPAFAQFVPENALGAARRRFQASSSSSAGAGGSVTVPASGMASPVDTILDLLTEELSIRGRACVALGRMLATSHVLTFPAALSVAKDLLENETVETCETLIALVAGGWNDTISTLLLTSRELNARNS